MLTYTLIAAGGHKRHKETHLTNPNAHRLTPVWRDLVLPKIWQVDQSYRHGPDSYEVRLVLGCSAGRLVL